MTVMRMAILTVRNVPDEVHRALRMRASQHGRSTEAEIRYILEKAVKPEQRLRLGDQLNQLAQAHGLTNSDIELLEQIRNGQPAKPLDFE